MNRYGLGFKRQGGTLIPLRLVPLHGQEGAGLPVIFLADLLNSGDTGYRVLFEEMNGGSGAAGSGNKLSHLGW